MLSNVFYSVREIDSGITVIPFDDIKNSTKVSRDSEGMFFTFSASNFEIGRSYAIDVMIKLNGIKNIYQDASNVFQIIQ